MSPETRGEQTHVVEQGECLNSIADRHGHFWQTIWSHPPNADLRELRGDPNVLLPGDRVVVPALRVRWEDCATDRRHTFERRGVPARLRLQILDEGAPRANEPYELTVDGGETVSGTLDGEGRLEHPISPGARECRLLVGEEREEYRFRLGHIDPVDEVTGVQGRLANLGFPCGPIDGQVGPRTAAALRDFQLAEGLEVTGETDQATRDRLVARHGS